MAKFDWGNAAGGAAKGAAVGSFVPGVGTVAGGLIGGAMGGFMGGGDDEIQPRPDYPYMAAENLYGWATDYQSKNPYDPAKPYAGELTAPMQGNELTAQSMLGNFMQSPTPSSLTSANTYNTNVLSGEYDPRTSPYYAAMKKQIMKDAEEANAAVLHGAASSGMLHSDPRHTQQRKLSENVSDQLATLLGGLYEAERGRMSTAAGQAPSIASGMTSIPMSKITAGSTIGAIPRQVEQADLTNQYNEYLRQLAGAREPLNILEGLSGKSYNPYAAQPYTPGASGNDSGGGTSAIMQMLPLLMSMGGGGGGSFASSAPIT